MSSVPFTNLLNAADGLTVETVIVTEPEETLKSLPASRISMLRSGVIEAMYFAIISSISFLNRPGTDGTFYQSCRRPVRL